MKSNQILLGCTVGLQLREFDKVSSGSLNSCIRNLPVVKFTLVLLLGVLAGCSLINPHISTGDRPAKPVMLESAIKYGNEAKNAYREALGDEAKFRNLLGVGLIGVATAIPIMALTEATTKSIGIVGVSGAGLYAIGTWLQSTPRQRAYLQGYNAVNCAIDAVAPLDFDTDKEPYKGFDSALLQINDQIARVEKDIGTVKNLDLTAAEKAKADEKIAIALETALKAVDEAKAARRSGIELQLQLAAAGPDLVAAVDRIVGEVDRAVVENQPDLAALASIIGGLGNMYGQLTALPPGMAGPQDITGLSTAVRFESASPLEKNLVDLQNSVAELSKLTRQISDYVNVVIAKKPSEKLRSCGVDADQIATDIVIEPPTAVFTAGQDETQAFTIRGGRRPFRVTLLGPQSMDIIVSQPDLFGPAFVVQVKSSAQKGSYSIYAADASGRQRILQIQIGDATPTPAAKVELATAQGGEAFTAIADINQRKQIQRALCYKEKTGTEPDGLWGQKTKNLLIEFQKKKGLTADGILTEELRDTLLELTPDNIQKECGGNTAALSPLSSKLKAFSRAIKGRAFNPVAADPDFSLSVLEADPLEDAVELELAVPGPRPKEPMTEEQLKEALIKEGKADPSLKNEHITIKNWDDIKDELAP